MGVRNGSVQHGRDNRVLKENSGGSKVQIKPPKQGHVRANVDGENPRMQKIPGQLSMHNQSGGVKKGSVNRKRMFEEDDDEFRSIIRKMFSARMARKEDEEEHVKMMEEERQEPLRKKAKMSNVNLSTTQQ